MSIAPSNIEWHWETLLEKAEMENVKLRANFALPTDLMPQLQLLRYDRSIAAMMQVFSRVGWGCQDGPSQEAESGARSIRCSWG